LTAPPAVVQDLKMRVCGSAGGLRTALFVLLFGGLAAGKPGSEDAPANSAKPAGEAGKPPTGATKPVADGKSRAEATPDKAKPPQAEKPKAEPAAPEKRAGGASEPAKVDGTARREKVRADTDVKPAKTPAAEPPKAVAEPSKTVAEPPKAAAEPSKAISEPSRVVAEPSKVAPQEADELDAEDRPSSPSVEPLGPGEGSGDRRVKPVDRVAPPAVEPVAPKGAAPPKSHRVGRAPPQPRATLPEGSPTPVPDPDARRQIAGGPTTEELSAGKNDAELRELALAERVLFPKALPGLRTGFAWDLPGAAEDTATQVDASGLPPGALGAPKAARDAGKQAEWVRGLTMPNLPTRLDARVLKYLDFYRDDPRGKNVLRIWAKKCGRLAPALRAELARAGLPTDLVWLSLIESGHNPTIVSSAGAAGLWQFVPESARMYGLTVDRWVDERLDPERSTEAAVRYLSDLRTRFGSWELAMAAYNMGHGGLLRSVRKFNTNDFWALSRYEAGLPWETTLYVPKILATAIAMANKRAFGIDDIEQDPPISFDTVSVGPNVDLAEVARAADSTLEDIRALNAAYLAGRTPPSANAAARFGVRVPAGRGLVTEQRLAGAAHGVGLSLEPHVVRFGETAESIAAEYGTTGKDLAAANHVSPDERLRPGSVVLVARGPGGLAEPKDPEVVVVPARRFSEAGRRRVFYKVLAGDAREDVAAAFGVSPSELSLWNALDPSASLQQGMALQVFVRADADLSRVHYLGEHEVRPLVAGTAEFYEYFEAQNGRKRITVVAKKGDTLAGIGKRYGMTTTMMERINRIPASSVITAGDRLVVYSKEPGAAPAEADDRVRALASIAAPMPEALPALPRGPALPNGLRSVAR
jgi:membrane-bound lytic murein transglycosylase D